MGSRGTETEPPVLNSTTASSSSTSSSTSSTFSTIGDKHEFDPDKWANDGTALPPRVAGSATDVRDVLIVGAGLAGLTAALECWRRGLDVVGILERSPGPNYSGDLIIIQPSALAMMRHWPQMRRELAQDRVDAGTYYYRFDGELIDGPSAPNFNDAEFVAERAQWAAQRGDGVPFAETGAVQIRRAFYRMLLRQVARLGLTVDYGQRVERYYCLEEEEEEEEDASSALPLRKAGVVLADGSRRTADVVIAADGLRSRSEAVMPGHADAGMRPSGMSVYRTAFPAHHAWAADRVRQRWQGRHTYEFWMGAGMHIGLYMSPDVAALGITPRDEFLDRTNNKLAHNESWDPHVDPDEVIAVMRRAAASSGRKPGDASGDWHPILEELVRTAPPGSLVHWPLLWRNLKTEWVSQGGRVVQIGDAAHATVPSSAAGGTLALEDAVTLAACLAAGGRILGPRVYNRLRYERASCVQKLAFVNAQTLGHTTDWDFLRAHPDQARLRYPRWLFRHDPEAYVEENWAAAAAHLEKGTPFRNTNTPPGHSFAHWTIDDIHRQIAEGKRVEDLLDGDWS